MNCSPGRAPDRVVKDIVTREGSAYTAIERLVAIAVADHLNAEGVCWPSIARLGAWTGLGRTAIRAALKVLCSGSRALFDQTPSAGHGSSTYRLRDDADRVATRPGSPDDPVGRRSAPGRHTTGTGSPRDHGTPNRTPQELPNGNTPPSPRTSAGGAALERAVATGKLLVVLHELEAYQIHRNGRAERRWRKWAREQLKSLGVKRGADVVQEQADRDAAEREAQSRQTAQLEAAAAAARARIERARQHGRPAGDVWTRFLTALQARVNEHAFGTWFRLLAPVAIVPDGDSERLVVAAAHEQACSWIARNYREAIDAALREVGIEHLGLELVVVPGATPEQARAG
jgi:hypothetical protein